MEGLKPESLLVCPYDPSHVIRVRRMQAHIYECRKSHPTSEKEACPFNAAHVILVAERRWHLVTCPDKHQVAGIIVQDLLPSHGCVETPVYEPLPLFDETWDDADGDEMPPQMPPRPQPVAKPAPTVIMTDEEVKGLNPRQRQMLYLQKKEELKEAAKRATQRPPPANRGPPHTQNSGTGQSRSLALFQQTVAREKNVPFDIYKDTLKGSKSGNMGIGRGRGAARGDDAASGQSYTSGMLGRGRDPALQSNGGPSPLAFTPIGRGAGRAAPSAFSPLSSGDASFYSAVSPSGYSPLAEANSSCGEAQQTTTTVVPGRGSVRSAEAQAGFPGLGAGATPPAGRGPLGVWQGGAAPVTVGALGRGSASGFAGSGMGIPFRGVASQPCVQAPLLTHSTVPGSTSTGQSYTAPLSASGGAASEQAEELPSSDGDDVERFVDAVPWVGGGYSLPGDHGERGPASSSSSLSLLAAPAIGPWALEVEKVDSLSESRSLSSVNDSEDFDGSDGGSTAAQSKKLKKLQKKLKQIKELEARKATGEVLDSDQEKKLEKKEEYEREINRLQNSLK